MRAPASENFFSITHFNLAANAFQNISISQNVKNVQVRGPEARGQVAPPVSSLSVALSLLYQSHIGSLEGSATVTYESLLLESLRVCRSLPRKLFKNASLRFGLEGLSKSPPSIFRKYSTQHYLHRALTTFSLF